MKVNELVPVPTDKVIFKLQSFKLVPKQEGCYVITTYNDEILYIGLSDNLYNRFQQHLDNPAKTNPTVIGRAIWFHYLIYDPRQLERLERTWLNQYESLNGRLPLLNKFNSPVS
jgi:excinuclease UvrABC nuclease subunit